ncbi:MAG TPA: SRPBCC family protein [Rhizobiaceae bacterium]|nr:SRPBCC family protein [Rhizobiaceae bacterium]
MPVTVATPSDTEFSVTRVFNAPARLVFDYHTKVEHVKKWQLGPDGWSMPVCEIDLRVGGKYHYKWRGDAEGMEFGARGEFKEIVAPTRLVHTESMYGVPGAEGEVALCTLTFDEKGGRTTLVTTMKFSSKEVRDGAMASGMADGMSTSYDRMEQAWSKKAA